MGAGAFVMLEVAGPGARGRAFTREEAYVTEDGLEETFQGWDASGNDTVKKRC